MDEIKRLLNEFEKFIEKGKTNLSGKKVTFQKDELLEYLDEINQSIPEQVRSARRIVETEDAIIAKAREHADGLVAEAQLKAQKILDESVLIHQAYERADSIIGEAEEKANRILLSANNDALDIRRGSLNYSAEILEEVQKICNISLANAEKSYTSVMEAMKGNIDELVHSRMIVLRELGEIDEESKAEQADEDEFLVNVSPEDFFEGEDEQSDFQE